MSVSIPTAPVAIGLSLFPAERPSGGPQAPPAGAVKRPSAFPVLTRADIEDIKMALYELELTRGDWGKSH